MITAANRAGFDVVCNEANLRETPLVVGFGTQERSIGEAGQNRYKSQVTNTMLYAPRFLGLTPASPSLAH